MRLILRSVVVPIICFFLCGFARLPNRAPEVPRVELLNVEGHPTLSMKSLRGRVVLIVFWNQNEAGFDDFMTTIKRWYGQDKSKGLEVLAVYVPRWDFGDAGSALPRLIKDYGLEFPVIADKDERMRDAYEALMSPAIFCIDRKGFIRGEYSGISDMRNVEVMLEALLEEAP